MARTTRSTLEVARMLGLPLWAVEREIREERIAPPESVGSTRVWAPKDVEALRRAIDARRRRYAARGTGTNAARRRRRKPPSSVNVAAETRAADVLQDPPVEPGAPAPAAAAESANGAPAA